MPRATKKGLFRFVFFLVSALIFGAFLSAQQARFAVVSDTHIGAGSAASALESVVAAVNSRPALEFVVVAGDITEKGRLTEFVEAKKILDGLKVPYYAVPGNHDSHWIGHGLTNFLKTWPEDRFFFQKGSDVFIGLNSWDSGHLAPEDIAWLEEKLAAVPLSAELFLFVHYPPETIDNWFRAHNLLKNRRAHIISGHVHFAAWESFGLSKEGRTLFVKSRLDEFNIVETDSGRLIRKISPAHGRGDLMPIEPIEWKGAVLFGAQNGFIYQIDSGRGGGRGPRLCLGICFRRTQPRIHIAGECPGLCPGVHFRRTRPCIQATGEWRAEGSSLDAEYHLTRSIFFGPAGVHTIQPIKGGLFAASNVDGQIVVFELK